MAYQLRLMQASDLSQVNVVLSQAFTQAREEAGLTDAYVPPCRLDFLKLYHNACPRGCFVIEQKGSVVAFVFSHLWGSVGWMGPLAVLPQHQGQGLGKQVVTASCEFLQTAGAKTIGLETMPRNYKNLGLYSKLGFKPVGLSLDLVKNMGQQKSRSLEMLSYRGIPKAERKSVQHQLSHLFDKIAPGLNYSDEMALNEKLDFGDTFIAVRNSQILGFAICHTQPYAEGEADDILKVNILALDPAAPLNLLPDFIFALERHAQRMGFSRLRLRVPTRYWSGYQTILALDFQIIHSDIRFTLEGFPERDNPNIVHFSRWE